MLGLALVIFLSTGSGRVAVFAEGKPLEVFLDDRQVGVVPPHQSQWFAVPNGTHHVRAAKTEWRIEVDRGFEQVLPIGGQCFVAFDVTNLLYEQEGRFARDTTAVFDNPVAARFFDGEPFELPERTWLELTELPLERSYTERASVLRQVPCSKRDATDEELSELAPRPIDFR